MELIRTSGFLKNICNKTNYLSLLLVLLFLISHHSVYCQNITFNKVFPPDRLSFNQINDIAQDNTGTMWFASNIGLYSYNGYEMVSYKSNQLDSNSIADDIVRAVCADNDGNIWVAVQEAGIDKLNLETGIFTHYKSDPSDPGSAIFDWVNVMTVDREGVLWIGTGKGLYRYDAQNDKFIPYNNIPGDSTSLSDNEIVAVYEDREGVLWIGTGSVYGENQNNFEAGGLNRMDKETGTFKRFKHEPGNPNSLIDNKVSAIYEDSKGTLWIGTAGDGLHTMDKRSEKITRHRFDPKQPDKLSRPPLNQNPLHDHIRFIIEDITGAVWIGTSIAGLNYYNPETKKITHFMRENNTPGAFTDFTTWDAFISHDNVLWISTLFGSLYHIDPLQSKIPHVDLPGQDVDCFYEDENGTIWWGTRSSSQIKASANTGGTIIHNMNRELQKASAKYNFLKVIKQDSRGNLLMGGGGGLIVLNLLTRQLTHYKNEPGGNDTLSNINITCVSEDSENNLWIGTFRGLNRLNPSIGDIKQYIVDEDAGIFGPNFILDVQVDNEDNVWVALSSGKGLCILNESTGEFEQIQSAYVVNCLFLDSEGLLWAGTNDGLFYYDSEKKACIRYTDSNSLNEITSVSNIIEDDNKNLWISAGTGIIKINEQRTETHTYGKIYGVYAERLISDATYKDGNGFLYFGDETGYYRFLPSEVTIKSRPPIMKITGLQVADRSESSVSNLIRESELHKNEISLRFNQNTFSFDFVAIDYSNPEANQHLFMLENYDDRWRKANADRRAYYFNIPPGKYTFRVKGANSYGVWAEKAIGVVISPPWWKTIWAYTIYGLIFITGVWLVHTYQRQRVISAERSRSQQKELQQAREIEKAYTELKSTQKQLIHSEKMASLGELTAGIAHEIQNPLNFVNNFSELSNELLDELKEELEKGHNDEVKILVADVIQNLRKINQYGKRAEGIIKGMLLHSRGSSGQKELTDINKLADEYLRLSYHGFRAKDKTFNSDFKLEAGKNLPRINVVPQDIGRVLLNLINNAFYAVNEKSRENINDFKPEVIVTTNYSIDPSGIESIEIHVKDNGPGIPSSIKDKIFQPFFTTKATGEGTGLGLSLSYDIVKAHSGKLKVESKEGEGTEFIVQIPLS